MSTPFSCNIIIEHVIFIIQVKQSTIYERIAEKIKMPMCERTYWRNETRFHDRIRVVSNFCVFVIDLMALRTSSIFSCVNSFYDVLLPFALGCYTLVVLILVCSMFVLPCKFRSMCLYVSKLLYNMIRHGL